MYQQIKQLADEALALQNKDQMDAALREISARCHAADVGTQKLIAEQRETLAAGGNLLVSHSTDAPLAAAEPLGAEQAASVETNAAPAPAKAKKGGAE